ncbi:Hypothetical predicted protein [Podarcis lilfordi]|uniref:Uncharacterized protein n=1 Tax=Podarcis lilfordi TaxID=74358 RepID=A0AA35KC26_9SAUR|nr:Hypothetical predicted protein [Podarcis lilfordi]
MRVKPRFPDARRSLRHPPRGGRSFRAGGVETGQCLPACSHVGSERLLLSGSRMGRGGLEGSGRSSNRVTKRIFRFHGNASSEAALNPRDKESDGSGCCLYSPEMQLSSAQKVQQISATLWVKYSAETEASRNCCPIGTNHNNEKSFKAQQKVLMQVLPVN